VAGAYGSEVMSLAGKRRGGQREEARVAGGEEARSPAGGCESGRPRCGGGGTGEEARSPAGGDAREEADVGGRFPADQPRRVWARWRARATAELGRRRWDFHGVEQSRGNEMRELGQVVSRQGSQEYMEWHFCCNFASTPRGSRAWDLLEAG
jgi:hypothetical protein